MKLLVLLRHPGYARNLEPALRGMAGQGHEIEIVWEISKRDSHAGQDLLDRLSEEHPLVSHRFLSRGRPKGRARLAYGLRMLLDAMRFYDPMFEGATALRRRAVRRLPHRLDVALGRVSPPTRRRLAWLAARWERGIGNDRAAARYLRESAPDAVLVTPLVEMGSPQVGWLREARRLSIPTIWSVASWDNLTTKGLVHALPDVVLVWNAAQRCEAIELHGVPEDRVIATGAQAYDYLRGRLPARSRDEFLDEVGLPGGRPYVLYACSSTFVAPGEAEFVSRWLAALRESDLAPVREASVLVRPHPQAPGHWGTIIADRNAVVWPPEGTNPVDEPARTALHESLHHSAAVVGMNTSLMLEAAIVGVPILTPPDDEYTDSRSGTLHFRYLAAPRGGLVDVVETMEQHIERLAGALRDGELSRARAASFTRSFLDSPVPARSATENVVRAVIDARLASTPLGPRRATRALWRAASTPAVILLEGIVLLRRFRDHRRMQRG